MIGKQHTNRAVIAHSFCEHLVSFSEIHSNNCHHYFAIYAL